MRKKKPPNTVLPTDPDYLLGVQLAAQIRGVRRGAIIAAIRRHRLPATKVNNRWCIRLGDLAQVGPVGRPHAAPPADEDTLWILQCPQCRSPFVVGRPRFEAETQKGAVSTGSQIAVATWTDPCPECRHRQTRQHKGPPATPVDIIPACQEQLRRIYGPAGDTVHINHTGHFYRIQGPGDIPNSEPLTRLLFWKRRTPYTCTALQLQAVLNTLKQRPNHDSTTPERQ